MRFGAVIRYQVYSKSHGAVRCRDKSYGAVRCGSPFNGFCYGAEPIPVGKTVENCFIYGAPCDSTVQQRDFGRLLTLFLGALAPQRSRYRQRANKPHKPAGSCGFHGCSCQVHLVYFLRRFKRATAVTHMKTKNRINKSINIDGM